MDAIHLAFEFDEKPEPLEFIPLGDFHVGTNGCDEGHIKKYVDYIRRHKNTYWWGMGDFIDGICYSDKRFDPNEAPDWMMVKDMKDLPLRQAGYFLDLVAPIANKCLFMLHGNHEETVARHYHNDIASHIALSLGVPYLGYSGFVNFFFKWKGEGYTKATSTSRKVFVHHGWGGGRKYGGKVNKVFDFLSGFEATDYFMGHVHDTLCLKTSRLGTRIKRGKVADYNIKPGMKVSWGADELWSQDHCFGLTGTFLKSALYAEQQGYNPSFIGAIKWMVDPFHWVGGKKGGWRANCDVGTLTL